MPEESLYRTYKTHPVCFSCFDQRVWKFIAGFGNQQSNCAVCSAPITNGLLVHEDHILAERLKEELKHVSEERLTWLKEVAREYDSYTAGINHMPRGISPYHWNGFRLLKFAEDGVGSLYDAHWPRTPEGWPRKG